MTTIPETLIQSHNFALNDDSQIKLSKCEDARGLAVAGGGGVGSLLGGGKQTLLTAMLCDNSVCCFLIRYISNNV